MSVTIFIRRDRNCKVARTEGIEFRTEEPLIEGRPSGRSFNREGRQGNAKSAKKRHKARQCTSGCHRVFKSSPDKRSTLIPLRPWDSSPRTLRLKAFPCLSTHHVA